MARMKLEGQLGVVEYSQITVPDSVHMGDPAGLCGDAQGEELSERSLHGLEREARHARVFERTDGEL